MSAAASASRASRSWNIRTTSWTASGPSAETSGAGRSVARPTGPLCTSAVARGGGRRRGPLGGFVPARRERDERQREADREAGRERTGLERETGRRRRRDRRQQRLGGPRGGRGPPAPRGR